MAAKVCESIGNFGLALAVAGGVVNLLYRGVQDIVVGERTHFLIPWVQKPIIFDCRSRPRNVPVITGSKDLQNVSITLRILFQPVARQLPHIYTSVGEDHDERVLPSITTEILKSVVARFDAGELITQRELVSRQVRDDLTERAATFGLILDDVSLTHPTFGKEFQRQWKPNRWLSRKQREPDLWWKRLSSRRRRPSSLLKGTPRQLS